MRRFKSIYPAVNKAMYERNLKLYDLSHVIGKSGNYIARRLTGIVPISAADRQRLADFLGIPDSELVAPAGGDRKPEPPAANVAGAGTTLNDLKASNACFAPNCAVAAILGFETEKDFFNHMAHLQRPSLAGFPYSFIGQRLLVPRIPFIRFVEGSADKR